MYRSIILLICLGAVATAHAVPVLTSVSGLDGGTPVSGSSHGWTFTANQNITVTNLGLYDSDSDGFDISHDIGLFRVSDGALLTSGTMSAGTGDTLIDNFRYIDTTDVLLSAGQAYTIAYYSAASNSDSVITSATMTVDPVINILYANWAYTSGLMLPSNTTGEDRIGPNFLFTSSVPEPTTLALMGLGLTGIGFSRKRKQAA